MAPRQTPCSGNARARNIRQLSSWRQPSSLPESTPVKQVSDKAKKGLLGGAPAAKTEAKDEAKAPSKAQPKPKAEAAPLKRERLSQEEIERRATEGRCTYCGDKDHVRSTCIVGRIIRGVPRTELRRRIREGVCPVCGDPDKNRHTKKNCPKKQQMEQELFNKNLRCTKGASLQKWSKENPVQVLQEKEAKRKAAREAVAAVAAAAKKDQEKTARETDAKSTDVDEWMRLSDSSDTSSSTSVVTPTSVGALAEKLSSFSLKADEEEDLIDLHSD